MQLYQYMIQQAALQVRLPTGCQSSTRVNSVAAEAWMKAGEHFAFQCM